MEDNIIIFCLVDDTSQIILLFVIFETKAQAYQAIFGYIEIYHKNVFCKW